MNVVCKKSNVMVAALGELSSAEPPKEFTLSVHVKQKHIQGELATLFENA